MPKKASAEKPTSESDAPGVVAPVEYEIAKLRPADYNPRVMSRARIDGLKTSMTQYGILDPAVANLRTGKEWKGDGKRGPVVVGGHQRLTAAQELGRTTYPVAFVDVGPDDERVRATCCATCACVRSTSPRRDGPRLPRVSSRVERGLQAVTLRELEAQFLRRIDGDGRRWEFVDKIGDAEGLWLLCPKCYGANGGSVGTHHVLCWSPAVPLDVAPGPGRWRLEGESLDDLSLVAGSSSVQLPGGPDAPDKGCGAHFFVQRGRIVMS